MDPAIPASTHFVYRDNALHCDGVALSTVASDVGTPCYVYSADAVDRAYDAIDAAMSFHPHLIAYAIKANANQAILRRLVARGCGADIVSGGELARALRAGFAPEHIVFSGVGKRRDEIAMALDAGVRALHVENVQELDVIEAVAKERGQQAAIALRVNPDVDAQTHPYIATGLAESKFGLDFDAARQLFGRLVGHRWLTLEGIATHIGSQLASPAPLRAAVSLVADLANEAIAAGAPLASLDIGGGWPMTYGNEDSPYPEPAVFGAAIKDALDASKLDTEAITLITEPGRAIAGDAGVLLCEVLYTKTQGQKSFAIVDGAMTELIRPALYSAHHAIMPVTPGGDPMPVDVVGPVCESGDFIAKDRPLPPLSPGDLIAVRGAGAYAREMASTYNGRPTAPEVVVEGDRFTVVRHRAPLDSLWANET